MALHLVSFFSVPFKLHVYLIFGLAIIFMDERNYLCSSANKQMRIFYLKYVHSTKLEEQHIMCFCYILCAFVTFHIELGK